MTRTNKIMLLVAWGSLWVFVFINYTTTQHLASYVRTMECAAAEQRVGITELQLQALVDDRAITVDEAEAANADNRRILSELCGGYRGPGGP